MRSQSAHLASLVRVVRGAVALCETFLDECWLDSGTLLGARRSGRVLPTYAFAWFDYDIPPFNAGLLAGADVATELVRGATRWHLCSPAHGHPQQQEQRRRQQRQQQHQPGGGG